MKTGIMQPYFMPYIGYWQLVNAVDCFVVYDNIEYTKKGWFNRNNILVGDQAKLFTIPIKNDSDYLPVNQRYLSEDSPKEIGRILRIIKQNYGRAPYFTDVFPIIESCFNYQSNNLFDYLYNSIKEICTYLKIETKIVVSSTIAIDHSLKAQQKVIAICKSLDAETYINSIGGVELYDKAAFANEEIELKFIKAGDIAYRQFNENFIPSLSIIDIMMFNSRDEIEVMLQNYTLE